MDEHHRYIARLERWHAILAHVIIGLTVVIVLCALIALGQLTGLVPIP